MGGVIACFSLISPFCSPMGFDLAFHLSCALLPFPRRCLRHFCFIFFSAEPARFTGLKWKSIHTGGTAGEMERRDEGAGGVRH